ncbi:MAG: Gfo/Idh/MocA family oxidoreductase [Candidatus Bathyarchaeia archaeon]
MKVGIGVIGCGFIGGKAHIPSFNSIPEAKLVAIVDKDENIAKKYSNRYNIPYYLDYLELLENPEVQGVVVSVPTPYHFKIALDAMNAGKHVLCEMPLAPTIEEAEKLKKTAEEKGVILMPSLNFRFAPLYVKTKQLINEGALRNPIAIYYREFISTDILVTQWPSNSWAWDKNKSGGYPDFTLSVWSLDLAQWLMNSDITEIKWLSKYVNLKEYNGVKAYHTIGLAKFMNNAIGTFQFSALVTYSNATSKLEVFGDSGESLEAVSYDRLILYSKEPDKKEWIFKEGGTKTWGHYQMDKHFVECILKGEKPLVTPEDAVKAIKLAKKIVEQSEE